MSASSLPTRAELDPAYTWDLAATYPDEHAYLADLEATEAALQRLVGYQGRLGESAVVLADFFDLYWQTLATLQKLNIYANMPLAVDQGDQTARARAGRFQALATRANGALAFMRPELLELGQERVAAFMEAEPRLRYLERYFERLEASRPYVRSLEVEQVLGQLGDALGTAMRAYNSLANGELPFRPVTDAEGREREVARSTYGALIGSPDRGVRERAFVSYTDGFLAHADTLAELYLGRVKESAFTARVRGYPSTVEEQLTPREVPREVLTNVLAVFEANLGVWHRYWEARRKLLGVEELKEHDVFAPLSKAPPRPTYREAVEWIVAGMEPLGEEYVSILRHGLTEERWVDVYPNRGKRDGAFCAHAYRGQPYIMMSYQDDLGSVSTLAHELGHAMHSRLLEQVQPLANAGYAMMVAETASNFNQALLRPYLLERFTEGDERLALLEEAFGNFHRYFFIMPTLVRFELEVHQAVERGEGLTSSRLNEIMRRLFQEGYGDAIRADERTGITWATFGHLFVPFYTFQYAAGISAAAALASDVREGYERGDASAAERYLGFLRTGSAEDPVTQLRRAGVDMTTPAPIEKAFAVLEGYVTQLEELADARA
ncbi:MAG: oligoendopeptidase F [Deinococcales bacterium]|nr:oligoendopeptidase F [Deinococcales bacterium]